MDVLNGFSCENPLEPLFDDERTKKKRRMRRYGIGAHRMLNFEQETAAMIDHRSLFTSFQKIIVQLKKKKKKHTQKKEYWINHYSSNAVHLDIHTELRN